MLMLQLITFWVIHDFDWYTTVQDDLMALATEWGLGRYPSEQTVSSGDQQCERMRSEIHQSEDIAMRAAALIVGPVPFAVPAKIFESHMLLRLGELTPTELLRLLHQLASAESCKVPMYAGHTRGGWLLHYADVSSASILLLNLPGRLLPLPI